MPTESPAQPSSPRADTQQQSEAMERQSVSADVVYEAIRLEGEEELDRSTSALFWSGLAAGLAMGFSFLTQGVLQAALPPTAWRPLVAVLGYTVGFVFVVLGRQQLFTENTLTPILPLLKDRRRLGDVARLWSIVLLANLLGALVFAWVTARTPLVGADVHTELSAIAREVIAPAVGPMLLRAVFAGWLIALMVWLLPGAESARLAVIVVPTYLIALLRFPHSIAGSIDVLYLVAGGQIGVTDYFRFIGPTLLGNVLGGVTLVALLNHAQVTSGETGR
jgi:formate-nitrite transporter family protein